MPKIAKVETAHLSVWLNALLQMDMQKLADMFLRLFIPEKVIFAYFT